MCIVTMEQYIPGNSGWGYILCPLSEPDLSDPVSHAISVGATCATLGLLAMSFGTFLTALALVPSGLSIRNR